MDYSHIEHLVNRYWKGETSLEEEQELKTFFTENQAVLPHHLQQVAPLFSYFKAHAQPQLNDPAFEKDLLTKIKNSQHKTNVHTLPTRSKGFDIARIAATLALLLTLSYALWHQYNKQPATEAVWTQDTYENPELAYAETKKALLLLSNHLNQGKQEAGKLAMFSRAEQKIKQSKK